MTTKISSDESESDRMFSTQSSSPEREQQTSSQCSSSQKTEQRMKRREQLSQQSDCCSHKKGRKSYCCFGLINITPIANAYGSLMQTIFGYTKYYFYLLVIVLYPMTYYRYFVRKGQTPLNDLSVLLKFLITGFLSYMAYWSHTNAGPANDPGFVDWDHFRTVEDRVKNEKDRQKWMTGQGAQEEKKEQSPQYPMQCEKCGSLKVVGVHHCGKCNRCVYKMDHHCPWTNNCVGYLTLKPFILFLFYVSSLCFFTSGVCYKQAWDLRMQHISITQTFIPAHSNIKWALTMWYLNDTEKEELRQYNQLEYERQVEFEKENPDIISWAFFKEFFFNWTFTKYYFMYSWETFWDGFAISLTMICGLYTFGLMCQTLNFAKNETSMIDDMKIKTFMKDRKKFRKELIEWQMINKRRKKLTMTQLCELVFGESSYLSLYTYIPKYRKPRSIDLASEEYLECLEEDEKKFK